MIERHRGEHQAQEIWRPRPTVSPTTAPVASATKSAPPPAPVVDIEQIAQQAATGAVAELAATVASAQATRQRRSRARITLLMLAVAIALFVVSAGHGGLTTGARHASALPATPEQWVDAYEGAAIDNPHRVCTQLLSPQLAAAYAAAAHSNCTNYFARIRSTSLRLRRILQDGSTAVVELHQTIEKTNWNVVLDWHGRGWRAVDLTPGRPLR